MYFPEIIHRKENDAKALAEKVARKKEMEEAIARFDRCNLDEEIIKIKIKRHQKFKLSL